MPMPAPLLAILSPSLTGGFSPFGRRESGGVVIPTYTNIQKLSLSPSTSVGTQVKVSDGFALANDDEGDNGFFAENGTQNGRPKYACYSGTYIFSNPNYGGDIVWDGTNWSNNNSPKAVGGAHPWEGTPIAGRVFTHPAAQQLAAPSSVQGGVVVSGGTQDGIYVNGLTSNSKQGYDLLGQGQNVGAEAFDIEWFDNGFGNRWYIFDGSGAIYYSLSNVATPDLASNWKNASDDSPASLAVTSIPKGDLDAGILVSGAGTTSYNQAFVADHSNSVNGQPRFLGIIAASTIRLGPVVSDPPSGAPVSEFGMFGPGFDTPFYWNVANEGFPWDFENDWQLIHNVDDSSYPTGQPPAPTVIRSDVAAEANWSNV